MEGQAQTEVQIAMNPQTIESAFVDEARERAWHRADAVCEDAAHIEAESENPLPDLVRLYGERDLLKFVTEGDAATAVSSIHLCLVRERLGYQSPLCDLAFAMQGLGSYPMTHCGGAAAQEWLPKVVRGEAVAAFALTEPNAGSDLGGMETSARQDGDDYVLNGHKIFISNAGLADIYTLFAVTDTNSTRHRLSAFAVPANSPGLSTRPMNVLGGHPIGEVMLDNVRVPARNLLGSPGRGLGVALATLHRFRPTVAAAAVGFAQRALDESISYTRQRRQFGASLSELAIVQARLAEMACEVETSRLLVYRAASAIDRGEERGRVSAQGSMAKLVATEGAQRVIDTAVQLHGGRGVISDSVVARLYEDVRSLRIYEGTNDVQKLLIARELLR